MMRPPKVKELAPPKPADAEYYVNGFYYKRRGNKMMRWDSYEWVVSTADISEIRRAKRLTEIGYGN